MKMAPSKSCTILGKIKKFLFFRVTIESFLSWKAEFDEERLGKKADVIKGSKLTGYIFFYISDCSLSSPYFCTLICRTPYIIRSYFSMIEYKILLS